MNRKITTETSTPSIYRDITFTQPPEVIEKLNDLQVKSIILNEAIGITRNLLSASHSTGLYVKILPEYSYCPVLIGSNNEPFFLYKFLEVLDEILDYDELKRELPNLSYSQINGAISFLRKLAQFNLKGIDIDEFEAGELAENNELREKMRNALSNEEGYRVLNID